MPKSLHSTTASRRASNPATNYSNYVRCDKCRLKFPENDIGSKELRAHRGSGACHQRRAEKEIQKVAASATAMSSISAPSAQSVSHNTVAPPPRYEHPAVLGTGGFWTKRCDLCDEIINLGRSVKGNCFDAHRNSKVCQKAQRAPIKRKKRQEEEQELEEPRGLMKFFTRTSSQSSLDTGSASGSKGSSKINVEKLTVPSIPAVEKKKSVAKSKTGPRSRKPSDADRTTLARDIRRALAEIPAGAKRENIEQDGKAKNKSNKSKGLRLDIQWRVATS